VSGRPFQLFGFADRLSRKHNIPWIADYRDDWNTVQWKHKLNSLEKFILRLESRSEKKWLETASCFLTVSEPLKQHIGSFINKEGFVIMNGFDESDYPVIGTQSRNTFRIVYNGTLYDSQDLEGFLKGFSMFLINNNRSREIELIFAGTATDERQMRRVIYTGKEIQDVITVTKRLPKEKVIEIQSGASVLLMLSHPGTKGNYSSKIFEYLALRIPVLLYPGDKDVLSDLVQMSGEGRIADTSEGICEALQFYYDRFKSNTFKASADPVVYPFNRQKLCANLCTIIHKYVKS
jgi:glycosyltransferase involved in cell wall biosynthesis